MSKDKPSKVEEIKTLARNVGEFLDAVSFTAVALFTLYVSFVKRGESNWYWGLLAAALIVAVQAFGLLIKHFKKESK